MLTIIILIGAITVIFGGSFILTSKLLQRKNALTSEHSIIGEPVPSVDSSSVNYCPFCGEKLTESAKFCSECGKFVFKNQPQTADVKKAEKRKLNMLFIISISVAFVLFLSIIFSKDSNSTSKPASVTPETAVASEPSLPSVGDTLEYKGVKAKFHGVKESNGSQFIKPDSGNVYVLCEFTIENNSSSDIGVSSLLSFECYVDDYATSISLGALSDDSVTKQLDGSVAPGKKIRGYVCYEVPRNWSDLEIHFIPYLGSARDLVFYYEK